MTAPDVTQRWRDRRDSYRPAGETIRTAAYDVVEIASDAVARAFVERHHYSGSYPAARFRFGLYHHGELVGVAVYSHPCSDSVLANTFPGLALASAAELGRFVLLDSVPANGETWLLARTFEMLRGRLAGILSFSDPMPRITAAGAQVFPGHLGTIYQSANARYLGRGTPRTLRILPDARVLSARSLQKIRAAERGWRPAAAQLVAHGAAPIGELACAEERREWLATWLPQVTRTMRHPGNHRYAWVIDRRERKRAGVAPQVLPYPKRARTAAQLEVAA